MAQGARGIRVVIRLRTGRDNLYWGVGLLFLVDAKSEIFLVRKNEMVGLRNLTKMLSLLGEWGYCFWWMPKVKFGELEKVKWLAYPTQPKWFARVIFVGLIVEL